MTPAELADAAWALRRAYALARQGYPALPRPGRARRPAAAAAALGAVAARFAYPTPPAQRSAIGTARAGVFPAGVEAPADREAPARPSSQPLSSSALSGQLSLGGLR
jgi:hypothetical protein